MSSVAKDLIDAMKLALDKSAERWRTTEESEVPEEMLNTSRGDCFDTIRSLDSFEDGTKIAKNVSMLSLKNKGFDSSLRQRYNVTKDIEIRAILQARAELAAEKRALKNANLKTNKHDAV